MDSLVSAFHFSEPAWLWALLLCIPVALWLLVTPRFSKNERLRNYADGHLLPYLIGRSEVTPGKRWKRFLRWTGIWVLLVLAMAGPRWDYRDEQLFRPGSNLVVLFDISRSMNVADVKPNRLARARQEVEDLLNKVRWSMEAGATGLIFGRNMWQRPLDEALALTEKVKAIIAAS